MIIRAEAEKDTAAITEVTIAAFRNHPFSRQTEHFIVNALRDAKALTISLVAEREGKVVGHIAFSPVRVQDGAGEWYGLGPVSVLPELQRQGIGKALVNEGLSRLRGMGARGCALVGPPEYYGQFGFRNDPQMTYEGVPQEVFLVLPFTEPVPEGNVKFHEAFGAES